MSEFLGLFYLPSAACADYVPSPPCWVGSLEFEHFVSALGTGLVHIPVYSLDRFVRSEAQVHAHVAELGYLPALRARFGGHDAVCQVLEGNILMASWTFPQGLYLCGFHEEF